MNHPVPGRHFLGAALDADFRQRDEACRSRMDAIAGKPYDFGASPMPPNHRQEFAAQDQRDAMSNPGGSTVHAGTAFFPPKQG